MSCCEKEQFSKVSDKQMEIYGILRESLDTSTTCRGRNHASLADAGRVGLTAERVWSRSKETSPWVLRDCFCRESKQNPRGASSSCRIPKGAKCNYSIPMAWMLLIIGKPSGVAPEPRILVCKENRENEQDKLRGVKLMVNFACSFNMPSAGCVGV